MQGTAVEQGLWASVLSPSLVVYRMGLKEALSNLVWPQAGPALSRRSDLSPPAVPSHPAYHVIVQPEVSFILLCHAGKKTKLQLSFAAFGFKGRKKKKNHQMTFGITFLNL